MELAQVVRWPGYNFHLCGIIMGSVGITPRPPILLNILNVVGTRDMIEHRRGSVQNKA